MQVSVLAHPTRPDVKGPELEPGLAQEKDALDAGVVLEKPDSDLAEVGRISSEMGVNTWGWMWLPLVRMYKT